METLDPQAVALAKAIRQTESGGNFTAQGKSGEYGAYQFTEPTWNTQSKKYGINTPLNQATPQQQNEVAYKQIKEWKDAGNNVGQIASMWNAGESRKNAYLEGNEGVNKYGVKYDTSKYAKSVAQAYQTLKQGGQVNIDPHNPSSTANTDTTIPQEKSQLESQGEGVSVQSDRAEPTMGGQIIRGLIRPFVRAINTPIEGVKLLAGQTPEEAAGKSSYLGDISGFGMKAGETAGQRVKDVAGGALELGSYLIGAGEVGAGAKALEAGKIFSKGLLKTAGKAALEGAGIGTVAGTGQELQNANSTTGSVITKGIEGGIFGGITGGVLGAGGGILGRMANITPEIKQSVQNALGKEYIDALSQTVRGRTVLSDQSEAMNNSIEEGILPGVKNGRFDTSKVSDELQGDMDKLGKARGEEIAANNRPLTPDDMAKVKTTVLQNVAKWFADSPKELEDINKFVNDYFSKVPEADLVKLDKMQIKAGENSKFANQSDATIRKAYRQIYFGLGDYLNGAVGQRSQINQILSKYHGIMKFLDSIHEHKVSPSILKQLLSRHGSETVGAAVGAAVGHVPGAVIGMKALPIIENLLDKVLGRGTSQYQRVMNVIRQGKLTELEPILKDIEKQKGTKIVNDIRRELQKIPQLTSGGKLAEKGIFNRPVTKIESSGTIKLPASSKELVYEKGVPKNQNLEATTKTSQATNSPQAPKSQKASKTTAISATTAPGESIQSTIPQSNKKTSGLLSGFTKSKMEHFLTQKYKDYDLSTSIYESPKQIELTALHLPEGNRGKLIGTSAMKDLITYAKSKGKEIILKPTEELGGSIERLIKLYKGLGFSLPDKKGFMKFKK